MSQPIDPSVMSDLKDLLDDGFPILIERFSEDGQVRIDKIKQAINDQATTIIYEEAHGLKGSSRNIGAGKLADHCSELESMGHAQNIADANSIFAAIEQEFKAVTHELQRWL